MRRTTVVASGALIATLALAALPAPATSGRPSHERAVDATTFEILDIPASLIAATSSDETATPAQDPMARSAGTLAADATLAEPGVARLSAPDRPAVDQPGPQPASTWKPPRFMLRGLATFYDNGTTAMRLPRGTVVVICMAGGCLERVVNDYGPFGAGRIVDLDRQDFFAICGCPSWSGVEDVTVSVY